MFFSPAVAASFANASPPGFERELARVPAAWAAYLEAMVRAGAWPRVEAALSAASESAAVAQWESLSPALVSVAGLMAQAQARRSLGLVAELLSPRGDENAFSQPMSIAWAGLASLAEREATHWPSPEESIQALFGGERALAAAQKMLADKPNAAISGIAASLLWSGRARDELLDAWGASDVAWDTVAGALWAPERDSTHLGIANFSKLGMEVEFRDSRSIDNLPEEPLARALRKIRGKLAHDSEDSLARLQRGMVRLLPGAQAICARELTVAWQPLAQKIGAKKLAQWAIWAAKKVAQERGRSAKNAWEAWLALADSLLGTEAFQEKAIENWDFWDCRWGEKPFGWILVVENVNMDFHGGSLLAFSLACDALGEPGWASECLAARGIKPRVSDARWASGFWESLQMRAPSTAIAASHGPNPKNPRVRGVPVAEAAQASLAAYEAAALGQTAAQAKIEAEAAWRENGGQADSGAGKQSGRPNRL